MSKSRGNVVAPDDLVRAYGADAVRAYLMFFARWEQGAPWNSSGIDGVSRWLRRVWATFLEPATPGKPDAEILRSLRRKAHQTLRSVTRDYEDLQFNTIVSSLMELLNEVNKAKQQGAGGTSAWDEVMRMYLCMLAPVAPHISEEIWERLGLPYSIHTQTWPELDEQAAAEEMITLVVQVNGKVRDRITIPVGLTEEEAKARALSSDIIQRLLEGKEARQVIVVPGRLVNIVV